MKAIERVMAAYRPTYKVTEEQAETVRKELSKFIDELFSGRAPEPPKSNQATAVFKVGH
jgi:hypothetical protein